VEPRTLPKDWIEFIDLLNSRRIEYVIVGAFALSHHILPRNTSAIDFLIRPTRENAGKLVDVLRDFGFASLEISEDDILQPGQFIQRGYAPNRIDLLNQVSGVDSETVWSNRVPGLLAGRSVNYMGREDLIRNKEATGRGKDSDDAKALRRYPPKKPKV